MQKTDKGGSNGLWVNGPGEAREADIGIAGRVPERHKRSERQVIRKQPQSES